MDDKLEQILKEGIASYASGEPLAGLENRILGRIHTTLRKPGRRIGWQVAIAVVLAATVLLFLPSRPQATRVQPVEVVAVASPRVSLGSRVQSANFLLRTKKRHRYAIKAQLPKLPVFPAPTPLTAEEHRLIALLVRDPAGTAAAFESLRKQSEPLQIEELTIQPLETGGGQ
jgi:hypothetical protein